MSLKKLLLIESNPGDALLIKLALQDDDANLEIVTIETIAEGLDYLLQLGAFDNYLKNHHLSSQLPESIFMGLSLPDTEWLDFLALIKRHKKLQDIPVMIFADSCASRNAQECINLGAERFMTKPLFLEDYVSKLSFLKSRTQPCLSMVS